MTTDEHPAADPAADPATAADTGTSPAGRRRAGPSWWHRSHPVFVPLAGFFTGLVVIIAVPGGFAAVLSSVFGNKTAEHLFPYVATLLAVPVVLTAVPRTRRFGKYLLLGMLTTLLVVLVVGGLTFWFLYSRDG